MQGRLFSILCAAALLAGCAETPPPPLSVVPQVRLGGRFDAAKSGEIAVAQGIRQRQHLQRAGHALHLGIQHQANAAHVLEHALGGVPAVLFVIIVNDSDREKDQRQRGARDQKGETHWQ